VENVLPLTILDLSLTNSVVVRQIMHAVRSQVMQTCFASCNTTGNLPKEMTLDGSCHRWRRTSASYCLTT